MAGAQLDASLRRATALAEARGYIVTDTQPVLEPSPQIIIENDDEDIFLDFEDGLGYTTDKNVYKNYGYKSIWIHNGVVQDSASAQSVSDDLDNGGIPDGGSGGEGAFPVYNEDTGKYEAKKLKGLGSMTIQKPVNRTYILIPVLPWDVTITDSYSSIEAGPFSVVLPSGDYSAGDPLVAVVSGTSSLSRYLTLQTTFEINLLT